MGTTLFSSAPTASGLAQVSISEMNAHQEEQKTAVTNDDATYKEKTDSLEMKGRMLGKRAAAPKETEKLEAKYNNKTVEPGPKVRKYLRKGQVV